MPYDQNMRKGTRMHTVFEQFNLDTQSLPRLVESVRLTCQQSDNPIAAANALITSVGGEQLDTENPAFARLVASKLMQQTFMDTGLDQAAAVEHAATYLKNFPIVSRVISPTPVRFLLRILLPRRLSSVSGRPPVARRVRSAPSLLRSFAITLWRLASI
jgi:hypothetical protein